MDNENKEPKSISERFQNLAAEKTAAGEEIDKKVKAEEAEKLKKNVLVRWNSFINGTIEDDDYTDKELELFETVDDESLLTLDDEGHLCLLSEVQAKTAEDKLKDAVATIPENDSSADTNDALKQAAASRRIALRNSHAELNRIIGEEGVDFGDEEQFPGESLFPPPTKEPTDENAEDSALPEAPIEENVPVDESMKVLRLEDIGFDEARIYISTAENTLTGEQSYGAYLEQGYGQNRIVFTCGERGYGLSKSTMAYRAAALLLNRFTMRGQPIVDVTIFMEHDLGWELRQNSWALVTDAYNADADLYSQTFRSCSGNNVKVRIAPAEGHGPGQEMAKHIAEQIDKTPS